MTARPSRDLSRLPDWPRYLAVEEAAAYLSISANTLRTHVPVTPVRIGGCVRYDRKKLDEYADGATPSQDAATWADDVFG